MASMTTIHLLRHGQTALSREDVFCGSGLDPELTSEGLQMVQAFVNAYHDADWRAVYSSGLRRSITTAQPLCHALGMDLQVRAELNEIGYGRGEGLTKEQVDLQFHNEYIGWLADPAWHSPTGGELVVVVSRRALQVVEEIRQKFTDGNILLVSHKATIRIVLCSLLGIDVGSFRYRLGCPVGSVSIIEL